MVIFKCANAVHAKAAKEISKGVQERRTITGIKQVSLYLLSKMS
jgi:hypothetical protein